METLRCALRGEGARRAYGPEHQGLHVNDRINMATEIAILLTLRGDGVDPRTITSAVQLEPSQTWRKGDVIGNSTMRQKQDGWRIATERRDAIDLGGELDVLLKRIKSHVGQLREVCDRFKLAAEFECIVHVTGDVPSMHFTNDAIETISELGAAVDIDLYLLPNDEGISI